MELVFKIIFWSLIALNLYIFLGYPLVLWISKFFMRNDYDDLSNENPTVTLLISVYNEEKIIAEKLKNSLLIDYPGLQIVVSSDGSTDRTVEIANEFKQDNLKVFEYRENRGKNAALNASVAQIDSNIVVFSDANVLYHKDCIRRLVERFSENVGCVVGELRYENFDESATAEGEVLYWKYEYIIKDLESRLGKLLISNGGVCAIRRDLYPELYLHGIADDFQIPIEIAADGYAVVYEKNAIGFEKTATDLHDEFNRKVRIVNQGLLGYNILKKKITGFRFLQFISHKWLRWFLGIWAIGIFLSNLMIINQSVFYQSFFYLQVLFYIFALIGYLLRKTDYKFMIFYIPMYFCTVNVAGLVALVKYLRGDTFERWKKAESAR